ncbi:MAG: hypothetical protein AB8G96_03560 [Phycisphaerales bacterium]
MEAKTLTSVSPVCAVGSTQWIAAGAVPLLRPIVPTVATPEDKALAAVLPINTSPGAILMSYLALLCPIFQAITFAFGSDVVGSDLAGAVIVTVVALLIFGGSVLAWKLNRRAKAAAADVGQVAPRGFGRIVFAVIFSGLCVVGGLLGVVSTISGA